MSNLLDIVSSIRLSGPAIRSVLVAERRPYSVARGYDDCDCDSGSNCDCSQGGDCNCTSNNCDDC